MLEPIGSRYSGLNAVSKFKRFKPLELIRKPGKSIERSTLSRVSSPVQSSRRTWYSDNENLDFDNLCLKGENKLNLEIQAAKTLGVEHIRPDITDPANIYYKVLNF